MKRLRLFLIGFIPTLLVVIVLLVSIGDKPSSKVVSTTASEPTEEAVAPETSVPGQPTETPASTQVEVAELDGPAEDAEPNYCLDCHTNKQLLIDTADPVGEVVDESEGEG